MDSMLFGGLLRDGDSVNEVVDVCICTDGAFLGTRIPDGVDICPGRFSPYGFRLLPLSPPVIAAWADSLASLLTTPKEFKSGKKNG